MYLIIFIFSEKLKSTLKEVKNVAITTDLWTSRKNISFNTITCHYYDMKNRKLMTKVLKCAEFVDRHFTEAFFVDINESLKKFEILKKLAGGVSDNERAICGAIRRITKNHWGCTNHTLNLVHTDSKKNGPERIRSIIEMFSNIVTFTRVRHFHLQSVELEFT